MTVVLGGDHWVEVGACCLKYRYGRFLHQSRRRQSSRNQRRRHTGARMGARSGEVEILVARVAVGGAQVAELGDGMAQAVRCASGEVVPFAPGEGGVVDFELDVIFEIGDAQTGETAE